MCVVSFGIPMLKNWVQFPLLQKFNVISFFGAVCQISTHFQISQEHFHCLQVLSYLEMAVFDKNTVKQNIPNDVMFSLLSLILDSAPLLSTVTLILLLACYHVTLSDVCTTVNDRLWNGLINSFVLLQTIYTKSYTKIRCACYNFQTFNKIEADQCRNTVTTLTYVVCVWVCKTIA